MLRKTGPAARAEILLSGRTTVRSEVDRPCANAFVYLIRFCVAFGLDTRLGL